MSLRLGAEPLAAPEASERVLGRNFLGNPPLFEDYLAAASAT